MACVTLEYIAVSGMICSQGRTHVHALWCLHCLPDAGLKGPGELARDECPLPGFKTFVQDNFFGPLDSSFTAIVGPNGLGKTVIADAVRFTLGDASLSNIRVQNAAKAISHVLKDAHGPEARCITEVGFCSRPANGDPCFLSVRRKVTAAGRSQYFAARVERAPDSSSWRSVQLPSRSLVRSCPDSST